jgi:hypothetical protein
MEKNIIHKTFNSNSAKVYLLSFLNERISYLNREYLSQMETGVSSDIGDIQLEIGKLEDIKKYILDITSQERDIDIKIDLNIN